MKRIWFFLVIILLGVDGMCKSYYNTAENNFGGLFPHPGMRMQGRYKAINEDLLIEENATMATALTIDTMCIYSTAYRYQLRLANLNNKQGKTMSIKNPMTGDKTPVTSTQWGLVFNYDDMGDYCAVVLSCDNSAPYDDITDSRTMLVSIIQRCGQEVIQLAQTTLSKGVSLEDEMNTLCVDVNEQTVTVSIGKNELQQVLEVPVKRGGGMVQVGYLVGPGARTAIERAVLTIENEKQVAATTLWTVASLDEYLAQSADPVEGYWRYLDRDMQDEWLRLGGRYTLAIVRSDDGYDLIYIDGAQVKKSMWEPGMLKGHLTPTHFTGNYDLMWIDATMEPIDKDAYATVENGIILTLNFPVYKSQVRLSKIINN
ncbi:MAG: hypothetical protein E7078_10010 [Bacteroidales bacterium]|nr:hypothetical protein [Bacteroidales bacterium]